MIRLLLWDIDGTILDFHEAQKHAIRACFEEQGLGICTDEMLAVYDGINKRAWQRLERREITKEQTLLGRFYEFFGQYGIPTECIPQFNASYQVRLGDYPVFTPGALETVKALKEAGIPQFAVTNGTVVAQERKLARTGLDQIFDGIFISDRIGAEKPSAQFFAPVLEAAERQVPGIRKDEILIIGDSLTSDMQGGLNAGIRTCWYRSAEAAAKEHAPFDYEIASLPEVLDLIGDVVR